MGGMQGFGPVQREDDEPIFHEAWEGRVWGMVLLGPYSTGRRPNERYDHETLPPADYLRLSYYERHLAVLIVQLLRTQTLAAAELERGAAERGPVAIPRVTPAMVDALIRPVSRRPVSGIGTRLRIGQTVRAQNVNRPGHTRLPRYVRGRRGTIIRDHGPAAFPDTDVDGYPLDPRPQHVFAVRFSARELWGSESSGGDSVTVDLWEGYLERT